MFAFALWDARRRRLLLARDRAGKKPLFYHDGPRVFAFASEVKALLAHPGVPHERDPEALPLFLTYGYVPTPGTFYRGIRALPPAHFMAVTEAGAEGPRRYWRARFRSGRRRSRRSGREPAPAPTREAEERFRALLRPAVERRLVADVPLGAFLSGGLDSSTVVALMAEAAGGRVKTFTIGFAGHTRVRRARARAGGGGALRDRAHGVRGRAQGPRPDRPAGVAPRRALRRLVGGADVPAVGADANEGHGGPQRRRGRRGVRGLPAPLRGRPLGAGAARGLPRARRGCSASCPSPPTASTRCASPSASPRRGACRSSSATCAGTRYFTADLPQLLKPELAAAPRPRAAARELPRELRRGRGLDARAAPAAQLRDVPPRRPAREDGPHVDGPRARGALALPRHRGRGVRRVAARPPADALRQGEDPAAPRDEGDPARVDHGAGQDGLRRAARGLVPERPRAASCASGCSTRRARSTSTCAPSRWPRSWRATGRPAADLSAQIWALLTLESWLRQEKSWGARVADALTGGFLGRRQEGALGMTGRATFAAVAARPGCRVRGRAGALARDRPIRRGPRTRPWYSLAIPTTSGRRPARGCCSTGQVRLLILTGGEPGPGDSATSLRDVAIRAGVPPERIRMEQVSRSTHGSMEAIRPILGAGGHPEPGRRDLALPPAPGGLGGPPDAARASRS